MATPKIIADFETQLATAIAVGGTSFSLASATDDDGVSLPAGLYYFTVDNGSTQKEYLAGTLSGTSVTGVVSVSRQGVETSGAARAHRVGASVIITDFATYQKYINEIALASSPDASVTVAGVSEEATQAEIDADTAAGGTTRRLFVNPSTLATSKYGTRLPSATQKDALAGGGSFGTPSTTNKYLTQDYIPSIPAFFTTGFTKKIAISTDRAEVANDTTTETAVFTQSISGGLLSTNNAIRFKLYVSDLDTGSAASDDLTIRLKYGATTLATITLDNAGSSNSNLKGHIEGIVYADGSATAQYAILIADLLGDDNSINGAPSSNGARVFTTGTAAENSANSLNLSLTVQWGNVNGANNFVPGGLIIELIS